MLGPKRTIVGGEPKSPGVLPRVGKHQNLTIMLQELNLQEMNEVKGGITVEEYCGILDDLMADNWLLWSQQERDSAQNAYFTHC